MKIPITIFLTIALTSVYGQSYNPFASRVIDISLNPGNAPTYKPAPGQFINNPDFRDPNKALGPPNGNTFEPALDSCVSLGGFGGQLVLAFDHDVEDNPANPLGMDAIIYGNTFWYSMDPQLRWAEPGTIEIMPELNGNDIPGDHPDEKWYLIPGSDNTGIGQYRTKQWNSTVPGFPAYPTWPDPYNTSAYEIFPIFYTINGKYGILINPNLMDSDPDNNQQEGYWGYAELSPTAKRGDRDGDGTTQSYGDEPDMPAELFYTIPDDPMTVGISPGSGGGDAFDIAWAVDPSTGVPANLDSFRYIRITTAVESAFPFLGETSVEIDAVADVRPIGDVDGDGDVDVTDVMLFAESWLSQWQEDLFLPSADWHMDYKIDMQDFAELSWGWHQYYWGQ